MWYGTIKQERGPMGLVESRPLIRFDGQDLPMEVKANVLGCVGDQTLVYVYLRHLAVKSSGTGFI